MLPTDTSPWNHTGGADQTERTAVCQMDRQVSTSISSATWTSASWAWSPYTVG